MENNMHKYLLDVTFYAGSDAPGDIDRGLFILNVDKEISEKEIKNIFGIVNMLLDPYRDDGEEFSLSYYAGLNINTLIEGVEIYTKGKIEKAYNNCGKIDNCYIIEQWQ